MVKIKKKWNSATPRHSIPNNSPQRPPQKKLSREYFGERMDYAIGPKEGRRCKPYPDMVDAALEAMGMPHEGAVYIGDSEVDVKTGLNAGLPVIAVSWGFRSRETVIEAGATVIADNAKQLEALLLAD